MPGFSSRHAHELFEKVLDLPPDERTKYLDDACEDDDHLRAEVESLIALQDLVPDDFMNVGSPERGMALSDSDDVSTGNDDALIGQAISSFRIIRLVASGGMGEVYAATQERPSRIVAVKILRHDSCTPAVIRRFEHESELLGQLRHPNIAQIHESGTFVDPTSARDRPYFAMEYVPNATMITTFADHRRLDMRAKLRLFLQACDAVTHGHQKGIIHRDLKPTNILVDEDGRVKVIDFGVARASDSDITAITTCTEVGQLIGTLQFMSPEQCAADPQAIDTRTDVYALGIVLYQLICGRLPYDVSNTTLQTAARIICEQPPELPSRFNRKLRGDLETIMMKAVEKNRRNRYQSVGDLARDITRFLTGDPIAARSPTSWSRVVRWISRHPAATTSVTCITIAVSVLLGAQAADWYLRRQPDWMQVHTTEAYDEAVLLTARDKRLKEWRIRNTEADPGRKVLFAELIRRPSEQGGGRLALLALTHAREDFPSLTEAFCAFDADGDLERPLWKHRILQDDIPTQWSGITAGDFTPSRGWVFDIFPEIPGEELVAIFGHASYAYCAIQIYSLEDKSRLLYQVWHKGGVHKCYWMSQKGLLIFAGFRPERNWAQRGDPNVRSHHASVVFAVRPKRDDRENGFLDTRAVSSPLEPVWYRYLLPPKANDVFDIPILVAPRVPHNPSNHVGVSLVLRGSEVGMSIILDEHGVEIPEARVVGNEYGENPANLVSQSIAIGDLPPIIDSYGGEPDETPATDE